jgi:DNA-binding SARP family transcriptional activator/ATP/maltotriose-dependent transcriptional regulator MalT
MTFEAKTLVPLPGHPEAANVAFEDAAGGGVTLLEAPAGFVLTEGLARALTHSDRHPVWLRLGPEDGDPAAFLLSLIAAARRFHDNAGRATLELMTQQPGPVFGWSPLFTQLASDLRSCLDSNGALVLEDIHYASDGSPTLRLVGRYLLPGLAGAGPCVLLSHRRLRDAPLDGCTRRSEGELRLSASEVRRLLNAWAPELSARARDRAVWLIGGRASLLAGLRELAAADRGLEPTLAHAGSRDELLAWTVEALLASADREARRALGLAGRIEYSHPAMTSAVAGESQLPRGPWLQHLEDGWVRLRPCWLPALRTVLGPGARPDRDTLHRSADWLLQAGAYEQAVFLYLDIGDHDCAAQVITSRAGALMDLGQWAMVDRWLVQLPGESFAAYPDLSAIRAEIAAARGDAAMARRWFDLAASQYARCNDVEGECRSLLAGSAVAAEAGDLATALSRAHAASSLASTDALTTIRMWASWQLGRVCMAAGDNDGALMSFRRAASSVAGDPAAADPVRVASDLATKVEDLRRRQEAHREAQAALSRAEHEALNQLTAAIRTPALGNDGAFGGQAWSCAPAPLKLSQLIQQGAVPFRRVRPLDRLRRALRLHRRDNPPGVEYAAPSTPVAGVPLAAPGMPGVPGLLATIPAPRAVSAAKTHSPPQLTVHMLGPLYVALDDVAVEDWPSARYRSLFGYLLSHRDPWPPREVLMEVFWPGSPPEASRNSLNVAIHGLRRTLRTITDLPVIVHAGGGYRINQDLRLWLDVDAFDSRVESGRRLEDAGETDKTMREYEFAGSLYRGDFMAEDPYEDWAALTRERLRLAHLDMLGRLSNLYFDAGQYTPCASLCQRIIERDPCREDAHRRLMRCYSRQGQPHLALMQYRACARALASELSVETDPATMALFRQIRRREPV